jgi:tetratricopeptide (TPR) repeat protein
MNKFTGRLIRGAAALLIWSAAAVSVGSAFQKAKVTAKEAEAINAMFSATTPDAQIAAAENLLSKFVDTSYKSLALYLEADCYSRKNDFEKSIVFAERSLEADPQNFQAMLLLARQYAAHTNENDLDKEEKLNKAAKYANDSIPVIDKAPKPNPNVPDDKWEAAKKDYTSQAHEALGMVADVRKKYDVAATEYKAAVDGAAVPDPTTSVRYAVAEEHLGKFDEAIAALDKVISDPNSQPVVKQYATNEKTKATNMKNAVKK